MLDCLAPLVDGLLKEILLWPSMAVIAIGFAYILYKCQE